MQKDDSKNPHGAYISRANPRKFEQEGLARDAGQVQNGSGFKGNGHGPQQNSDWYGEQRGTASSRRASAPKTADELALAAGVRSKPATRP
ncbi:hypothetical protein [Xylophilus sp. GOD-11R]|uniref:hypothetical protein n=1 Tax=Xylophilus sp. GOD-11R TaxID=3089814 RepID=UPI00298D4178|nr:hypothetical protein [Xylophilus sp. GOD-11R]WPB57558.1 hypothetical protein R9X41_02555 [Xylophilus sp. GOD-11R]